MGWFTRVIKAIKSVVSQPYKEPFWIVMTAIFGSCLTFLASSQSSRPEERSRLEKANYDCQVQQEDNEKMNALHDQIMAERKVVGEIFSQFISIAQDISNTGQLRNREQQYEEVYNLAVDARKQAELLLARAKGTKFRVPIYNEETRMIESLLAQEISTLKMMEDISAAYLAGDAKTLSQQLRKGTSQLWDGINEQETAIAQWKSMKMQLDSTFKANLIERDKIVAQASWHQVVGVLQVPALTFIFVYVLALSWKVKINLNKTQAVIPRLQRSAFKTKRRKKKR